MEADVLAPFHYLEIIGATGYGLGCSEISRIALSGPGATRFQGSPSILSISALCAGLMDSLSLAMWEVATV